ncbi:hypothetical protein GCM10010358_80690 [Streptomyces minutiscleroticus]|uniref:Uncharacterized protein n=1 Tax=Streptomyces minutiscleroticus TaxID=68238 RepID=A0A918P3F1_9ACTN|nr:hypothetical protein GCM10010358_80690 [Streptomyces minutiscleroticus]
MGRRPGGGSDAAGQRSAAQRAVGHQSDAQFTAGGQHLRLHGTLPQGVLALQGGHGSGAGRAAQHVGSDVAQSDGRHLPLTDQVRHGSGRLLDGHPGVKPVAVVQIDVVGAEAPQAGLARLADVLGPAVVDDLPFRRHAGAELGGDHDLRTAMPYRLAQQRLVVPESVRLLRGAYRTVDVRGVEEVDAQVDGEPDRGDRL